MKKVLKVLSAAMLSAVVAVSAAAVVSAAGLNAAEKKIMAELKSGVTLANGEKAYLSEARLNEAENYLLSDGVDLTDAQANSVIGQINAAKTYIANSGVTSLSQLDASQKSELASIAQKASDDANLGVTVSVSATGVTVSVPKKDTTGTNPTPSTGPSTDNNPIKTTGFDVPSVAAVAGVGILMVSAAGVYLARTSKKESVGA